MSPEIGGWNPALVFGIAVLAAACVILWIWTGQFRRTNFRKVARAFAVSTIRHHHRGARTCLAPRLDKFGGGGGRDRVGGPDGVRCRGPDWELDYEQATARAMRRPARADDALR